MQKHINIPSLQLLHSKNSPKLQRKLQSSKAVNFSEKINSKKIEEKNSWREQIYNPSSMDAEAF